MRRRRRPARSTAMPADGGAHDDGRSPPQSRTAPPPVSPRLRCCPLRSWPVAGRGALGPVSERRVIRSELLVVVDPHHVLAPHPSGSQGPVCRRRLLQREDGVHHGAQHPVRHVAGKVVEECAPGLASTVPTTGPVSSSARTDSSVPASSSPARRRPWPAASPLCPYRLEPCDRDPSALVRAVRAVGARSRLPA